MPVSESRAILEAAAFLDSASWRGLGLSAAQVREVVSRFLAACYRDLGKAPRLLDGGDLEQLLRELLPRHFGVRDPLAEHVEPLLEVYLAFLGEQQVVMAAYELRTALAAHAPAFLAAVAAGTAHRDGVAVVGESRPMVHRAERTGRNDPCPCGSGRKFKKCCMALGRGGPA